MEIVIESDPSSYRPASTSPAPYLRSPSQPTAGQCLGQQQPLVNTSSAFYYATLPRGPRLSNGNAAVQLPDGLPVSTSMRRIDKSGLLEIADLEPSTQSNRQTSSRLLNGASDSAHNRRMLEAVPEIPDPPRLASDELIAAAATARSMVERQQHLLGAENELAALLRRRSFATESQDSTLSKQSDSSEGSSVRRVKFADDPASNTTTFLPPPIEEQQHHSQQQQQQQHQQQSKKNSVVDCLGRLSPRRVAPTTLSNIPDVIENATTNNAAPEGERAEAEGCEHTSVEEPGYKSDSKVADNIQAVHVIILSEQL